MFAMFDINKSRDSHGCHSLKTLVNTFKFAILQNKNVQRLLFIVANALHLNVHVAMFTEMLLTLKETNNNIN